MGTATTAEGVASEMAGDGSGAATRAMFDGSGAARPPGSNGGTPAAVAAALPLWAMGLGTEGYQLPRSTAPRRPYRGGAADATFGGGAAAASTVEPDAVAPGAESGSASGAGRVAGISTPVLVLAAGDADDDDDEADAPGGLQPTDSCSPAVTTPGESDDADAPATAPPGPACVGDAAGVARALLLLPERLLLERPVAAAALEQVPFASLVLVFCRTQFDGQQGIIAEIESMCEQKHMPMSTTYCSVKKFCSAMGI